MLRPPLTCARPSGRNVRARRCGSSSSSLDGLPDDAAAGYRRRAVRRGHADRVDSSRPSADAEARSRRPRPTGTWCRCRLAQRPTGRTLADLLVPEQQDLVPRRGSEAVLASVLVAAEIPGKAARRLSRSVADVSSRCGSGDPQAQYSYGPQLGARPKASRSSSGRPTGPPAPGPAGRAGPAHWRSRASAGGRQAERQRQRTAAAGRPGRARASCRGPRRSPGDQAVARAQCCVRGPGPARPERRTALDKAVAELERENRRLRHTGADRDIPTSAEQVDAVERAVADFERAADGPGPRPRGGARLSEDLAQPAGPDRAAQARERRSRPRCWLNDRPSTPPRRKS